MSVPCAYTEICIFRWLFLVPLFRTHFVTCCSRSRDALNVSYRKRTVCFWSRVNLWVKLQNWFSLSTAASAKFKGCRQWRPKACWWASDTSLFDRWRWLKLVQCTSWSLNWESRGSVHPKKVAFHFFLLSTWFCYCVRLPHGISWWRVWVVGNLDERGSTHWDIPAIRGRIWAFSVRAWSKHLQNWRVRVVPESRVHPCDAANLTTTSLSAVGFWSIRHRFVETGSIWSWLVQPLFLWDSTNLWAWWCPWAVVWTSWSFPRCWETVIFVLFRSLSSFLREVSIFFRGWGWDPCSMWPLFGQAHWIWDISSWISTCIFARAGIAAWIWDFAGPVCPRSIVASNYK